MKTALLIIVLTLACSTAESAPLQFEGMGDGLVLKNAGARKQLVVSRKAGARHLDVTAEVKFQVEPATIARIDESGFVTPLANGDAVITARLGEDSAKISLVVSDIETERAISFPNEVIPQLTRAGCNSGACHGTPSGKNNFRLSLLGFEPLRDHEFLTKESRGRRTFPSAPDQSFLLQKASGIAPHGGGARIRKSSAEYNLLRRWIAAGMPYGPESDPTVERIEVAPTARVIDQGKFQQLVVTAFFSDGTTRDITRVAEYKANQPDMAEVDHHGRVRILDRTGTTSVMIRFQEHVNAFMATVPLGRPTPNLPAPSNFVDEHVFARLKTLGLPPSAECDDSTFLRRVTLDLTGRIPTLEETSEFLDSTDSDKRAKKIDALLTSVGYAELFANKWAGILRNKTNGGLDQVSRETYGFHAWILASLNSNKSFDKIATELITARGKPGTNPAVSWYRAVSDPKDQMADIAQVFLGVRIQCAQCHHHPYEKWSQDDYYGFAAFFSTIGRKELRKMPEDDVVYHKRILAVAKNPNTNVDVRPTPLDAAAIDVPAHRDPRIDLAKWMTQPKNPFFARMLANRYWKHFFGRGLVEPEDDLRVTNPPTHPELLDALAASFVKSSFDLKQLCRTICNSKTYQRTSFPNEHNGDDNQNFARFYPRRLSAEVMLDAINDVAGAKNNFNKQPVGVRAVALPDNAANTESFFLRVFGRPQMDTACECERTASADLAQSLHLINSAAMHGILSARDGRAVTLSRQKDRDDVASIRNLYLHALSRQPTENELQIALAHIERKKAKAMDSSKVEQAVKEAYEDIIWVAVNTKEFLFNH
ncbi:MAG: DUF1553 domain-containing protein [Planctomycetes bacterium]|nr:DUF1553 domain-containing protein [Planctomycetota bacterium]